FLFFCSFLRTLNRFGLAIIISISKILVKKSTDLKLNLPEPPPFVSAAQFFVQYRPTYFCCFSSLFYFFFLLLRRRRTTGYNAFNAFSSITFFFFGRGGRSVTFFR